VKTLHKSKIKTGALLCFTAIIALAGFMGVDHFRPDERVIKINGSADMTPVVTTVEKSIGTKAQAPEEGAVSGLVVDGKSALLMDAGSGAVLFEKNSHDRLPPASVTKIMTMLLVLEAVDRGQISLNDMVTISERAAKMGGSQMYMEMGEQHSLEDLMKGIAMVSANDACVAVAEYLGGSVEIFVEKMNRRAEKLGMKDTNFVNTNGLPVANHYCSAYDIAIMSRELIKHATCKEWFTTWQDTINIGLPGKEKEFGLTNTNRLIRQYPGADGIKTGFTQDAGYCLSGSATRSDMTLIAVIMGSPTSQVRFNDISKMLDYGFATYDTVKIAEKGESTGNIRIEKGSLDLLNIVAGEDISVLVKKGEKEGITTGIELDKNIQAPIAKGQQIGEIIVYEKAKEIERYPLVAEEKVEKASFGQLYIRMMKNLI